MPKKMVRTHRACERYEIDPDGLTGREWAQLIAFDASYSEKCDWTKLDGYDWTRLLVKHPEYAHRHGIGSAIRRSENCGSGMRTIGGESSTSSWIV